MYTFTTPLYSGVYRYTQTVHRLYTSRYVHIYHTIVQWGVPVHTNCTQAVHITLCTHLPHHCTVGCTSTHKLYTGCTHHVMYTFATPLYSGVYRYTQTVHRLYTPRYVHIYHTIVQWGVQVHTNCTQAVHITLCTHLPHHCTVGCTGTHKLYTGCTHHVMY